LTKQPFSTQSTGLHAIESCLPALAQGYEWPCIWERVQHLIVKSLISVQPIVRNNYRSMLPPDNDGFSCFEILGCVLRAYQQLALCLSISFSFLYLAANTYAFNDSGAGLWLACASGAALCSVGAAHDAPA